jgi:hypothetical protein
MLLLKSYMDGTNKTKELVPSNQLKQLVAMDFGFFERDFCFGGLEAQCVRLWWCDVCSFIEAWKLKMGFSNCGLKTSWSCHGVFMGFGVAEMGFWKAWLDEGGIWDK